MGRINNPDRVKQIKKEYTQQEEIKLRTFGIKIKDKFSTLPRIRNELYPLLDKYLPYDSVLDLGCGQGEFFEEYNKFNKDIPKIGVDMTPPAIEYCKSKFNKDFNFYNLDMLDFLNKQDRNSFDLVIAIASIEHIPDRQKVLEIYSQIGRVSKRIVCIVNYRSDSYVEHFFGVQNTNINVKYLYAFRQSIEELVNDVENYSRLQVIDKISTKMYNIIIAKNIEE